MLCFWLHQSNAYLKLGPFQGEFKLTKPEMILIHNFATNSETKTIINDSGRRMVASPKISMHEYGQVNDRTCKVTYLNDRSYPLMEKLTKRIERITKFNLSKEKFASENFKVMNYGLGGKIFGHWDPSGNFTGGSPSQII